MARDQPGWHAGRPGARHDGTIVSYAGDPLTRQRTAMAVVVASFGIGYAIPGEPSSAAIDHHRV